MILYAPPGRRPDPMTGPMNASPPSIYGPPLVNAHCREFEVNQ